MATWNNAKSVYAGGLKLLSLFVWREYSYFGTMNLTTKKDQAPNGFKTYTPRTKIFEKIF